MERENTHVVMVPSPGTGHLIPLTELARRLTESHNFSITFLIPNDGTPFTNSTLSLLNSLPNSITHTFLAPVDISDLPTDSAIETRILLILTRSIPQLGDSLRVMTESTRVAALVTDHFGFPIFDLAREFSILPYMFFLTSSLGLCFGYNLLKLDKMCTCEYKDLPEPVQFCPGSVAVHGSDFIDPVQDRTSEAYRGTLHMVEKFSDVAGIFVNSFYELEPSALKYLSEGDFRRENNIPPVYPVGPVVKTGIDNLSVGSSCLSWLDKQPRGEVLFVSFGSGGSLTNEQFNELAHGLELSRVRFLWVVKCPNSNVANATFFTVDSENDPITYLPQGFIERTRGLGLVVPSWVPQVQVLGHDSIGGFLTHCGWNSIMESVVHGKPMIAWPLFAEQKLNAVLITDDLKAALRVKPNREGLIGREQVSEYARRLIYGEEGNVMRERISELKNKAKIASSEGGSSSKSLGEVAQVWMDHKSVTN